ncbi:MAG: LysE family translocator, partial [Actinomycetia bacterium]|nr:LysE family translocator [Actinomycetes bacterium]
SAAQGRRAGLVSVAGIHLGTVVHVLAAMIGLSAVLAASATAFTVVKLIGAAYLIWLGVQSIRSYRQGSVPAADGLPEHRPLGRVFLDGVLLNILNPKTAIFFLSFVPQFVDPDTTSPALSVATLGATFIVLGFISDGAYALAGGWIGTRFRRSAGHQRKDLVAGGTYLGLGAITALSGNPSA